jgi:hypothetical protein
MATEDEPASGGLSPSPPKKNPFNFQTQFISTGPVKSVRRLLENKNTLTVADGGSLNIAG